MLFVCLPVAITRPLAKPYALYVHFLVGIVSLLKNKRETIHVKWDKVVTVIEVSKQDQYFIKVSGSGR